MKKIIISFGLGLLTILIILYVLAWVDLTSNEMLVDSTFRNIKESFNYYLNWLPYWWSIILIGTLILGLIFYGVGEGIKLSKKK